MKKSLLIAMVFLLGCQSGLDTESWIIDTQKEWQAVTAVSENLKMRQGQLHLQGDAAFFLTKLKKFQTKQKLWTEFQRIKETYVQKKGFVRVIETNPATLDVSPLKAGWAFKVELRLQRANGFSPVLDAVKAVFK